MDLQTALATVREHGYLLHLENTDGWYAAFDRLPRDLPEALTAEDIPGDDAQELIDTGRVTLECAYTLEGGTRILAFTAAKQASQTEPTAG
jgi:hypothetical protein